MKLLWLSFLLLAVNTFGFRHLSFGTRKAPISLQIKTNEDIHDSQKNVITSAFMKTLSAAVCGAALLTAPGDAFAARSGGRSGGSSFRSSPSASSSRLRAGSYTGTRSRSYSPPVVIGSPFGYGGYGMGYGMGFGFSPFSFIPINPTVLFLGFGAYALYNVLSNRVGGSDFTNDGNYGSLGLGASVMKIQLSLDADWSQSGNIMETLSQLSNRNGNISGRSQLAALLSDSSLTLLRKKSEWNSASFSAEQFNAGPRAEPAFQQLAISERAKFEQETTSSPPPGGILDGRPTQCVVSILVAVRGQSDVASMRSVQSIPDVTRVLQTLASEALTDEGENIMGVEVLWTPSKPGETLSKRDIVEDYPELLHQQVAKRWWGQMVPIQQPGRIAVHKE